MNMEKKFMCFVGFLMVLLVKWGELFCLFFRFFYVLFLFFAVFRFRKEGLEWEEG